MRGMQVIAQKPLKVFWEANPEAEKPLRTWYATVTKAEWTGPAGVKEQFGTSVDFIADNRLIFDISGNKYRLIVHAAYRHGKVLVKFIGTHAEYDKIDPITCEVK